MAHRGPTRFLSLLAIAGLVTLSCSRDSAPTAPATPQFDGRRSWGEETSRHRTGGILFCRPLPYAADTEVVGPAGATLHIGPHTLTIPAGALSAPVTIIGEAPSDTARSVRLFPHGLEFNDGVYLSLNYAGCQLAPGQRPHRVAYTDDSLNVLYYLESRDHPARSKVTAELQHFSRYAVGW